VTRYLRILFVFWSVWLSPLAAQNANILDAYNGDFESGLAQWRFFEVPSPLGSTATSVTTDVARGSKAMRLIFATPNASLLDRALDNWDTNVPVAEGQKYTVSTGEDPDTRYTEIAYHIWVLRPKPVCPERGKQGLRTDRQLSDLQHGRNGTGDGSVLLDRISSE